MTLGMAWIRSTGSVQELVVASDSRLSGGQCWDANPKIMLLPRSDCVISFAGNTNDAYPLMLQAYNAIAMFEDTAKRRSDITFLKGHLVRVFNHSRKFIGKLPHGQIHPDPPEAIFMLAGYSWRQKCFRIWRLVYHSDIDRYTFHSGRPEPYTIAFVGDKEAIAIARRRLNVLLKARGKPNFDNLNMEPFEVLRDVIRSGDCHTVGGAPQVVKVYEHMNVAPIGVYWPDRAHGVPTLLGRPLLPYERADWGLIDPDKPDSRPVRDARKG
jgi:hypothetical protein